MTLQVGAVLNERYRVVKLLNQGGFGAIYRVWDTALDRPCALKENLDTTGLSQLAFNSGATNVEQTQAASDATITVNGLSISRESNTITGAIHGVTLNLLSIDVGNPTQLTISQNTSNAEKNISSFAWNYNYIKEREEYVNNLTVGMVERLASKYVDHEKMIWLFVGDADTQLERLKELGYGNPVLINKL